MENYAIKTLEKRHEDVLSLIADTQERLARRLEEISHYEEDLKTQKEQARQLTITIGFLKANYEN